MDQTSHALLGSPLAKWLRRVYAQSSIMEAKLADLYLKALESERKSLWAACRLKGLAVGTPERQRIAVIDDLLAAHKAKKAK